MRVKRKPIRKPLKPQRVGCETLERSIWEILDSLDIRTKFVPQTSKVEQELADTLKRYSRVKVFQQIEAETDFSPFYLDMVCRTGPDRAIAIECDGHEYHEDTLRDLCRDALILGEYELSCIYRIEAWAVRQRPFDWLRILSELEPGLFTEERAESIRALGLCCGAMTNQTFRTAQRFLTRRLRGTPSMQSVFDFAQANKGIPFPRLVERVREAPGLIG